MGVGGLGRPNIHRGGSGGNKGGDTPVTPAASKLIPAGGDAAFALVAALVALLVLFSKPSSSSNAHFFKLPSFLPRTDYEWRVLELDQALALEPKLHSCRRKILLRKGTYYLCF